MINFIYGNPEVEFPLPNQPMEMLIKDFEKLNIILNDPEKKDLKKMLEAFEFLGVSDDIVNAMTRDQFIHNARVLKGAKYDNTLPPKEIQVKGRTYIADITDELNLSAKDIVALEEAADKFPKFYPSMVMAVIYKDSELTNNEHFVLEHIKHKSALFRNELPCRYAIPLLLRIARDNVRDLNQIREDAEV